MTQAVKIIGLKYEAAVYYAMYINLRIFDSPEEIKILTEHAGISLARGKKDLLIAPLSKADYDGTVIFTHMPETLRPREPYVLAYQFVRDRWEDIQSSVVLNINVIVKQGLLGWPGDVVDYME